MVSGVELCAVDSSGRCSILISTDLTLAATDFIRLYAYRFKIECTFREMKQVLGAFGYRFWSKCIPKLNRFLRKEEAHPLEVVKDELDRYRIEQTIQVIEGFFMCQCITMGLLQLIALRFSSRIHPILTKICWFLRGVEFITVQ
ncbi:hypothetical protein D3C76_479960 [compost metagenome]